MHTPTILGATPVAGRDAGQPDPEQHRYHLHHRPTTVRKGRMGLRVKTGSNMRGQPRATLRPDTHFPDKSPAHADGFLR